MAKARMLSTKASQDADLNSLTIEAELVFLLTIPHLDRDGLIGGDPIPLWGRVVPRRIELMDKMARIIGEWIERGLVVRYEWKDGAILFFPGFRKHNPNMFYEREPASEFPPPPNYHRSEHGLIPNSPELAGHLALQFDARSRYHSALMEASQEAKVEIRNTSGSPQDVIRKSSGEPPAEVEVEVEIEDQGNGSEENTNTNARALLTYACRLLMPEWNGGGDFLATLDDEDLLMAISWLWLYQKLRGKGEYSFNEYAVHYKPSPFTGVTNPPGFVRSKVEKHTPAPLYFAHRAEMMDALRRALQERVP